MYQGFKVLKLAHALIDSNSFIFQMIVAVCAALDFFKAHRDRGSLLDCLKKLRVFLHVPGQLVNADCGKLPPLGLGYVKNR